MCLKCEEMYTAVLSNKQREADIEFTHAQARLTHAKAIGALVDAADRLTNRGFTDLARRVNNLLGESLPEEPKVQNGCGEIPPAAQVDEAARKDQDDLPEELKQLIKSIVGDGVQVEVIRLDKKL